jgi:hypothetical protein
LGSILIRPEKSGLASLAAFFGHGQFVFLPGLHAALQFMNLGEALFRQLLAGRTGAGANLADYQQGLISE